MYRIRFQSHDGGKEIQSWLKSVNAFANGLGNSLFFGIDNDGIAKGPKHSHILLHSGYLSLSQWESQLQKSTTPNFINLRGTSKAEGIKWKLPFISRFSVFIPFCGLESALAVFRFPFSPLTSSNLLPLGIIKVTLFMLSLTRRFPFPYIALFAT